MSSMKILVEEDQQIFDDGDKNKKKVVIDSLLYDSLAKIFMLLPVPERITMEEVCTKWKEACQIDWNDITKYKRESSIGRCYDDRLLTQSYLEKIILRCGKYLNELSLSNVCNSSILPLVGKHCKNLTILECEFNDESSIQNADHFVEAFTQLDKLNYIKITVDHNYLNEIINLSAIINSLPEEINEIHLFFKPISVRNFLKQNISMTFNKFKNLQKLTIQNFCLDSINIQEIANLTTLVHLNIGLYNNIHKNFSLFNKLVNLEYIDLTMDIKYNEINIFTKLLKIIFCTCKNLKHLDLSPGPYDIAKIPGKKWNNLQNLEYLGVSCNIMPDLADKIVKNCKDLKHLRIHKPDHYRVNETALKKITELENLECLIFNGLCDFNEESIIAIANNCKKLKRLEIPYCIIISSIDGKPLSSPSVLDELSHLQYLEHLNLCYAENLKDSTIIAIANNCKYLKTLQIRCCDDITKTSLDALTNLENLQKLGINSINITDDFIIKLKGLKELDCCHCRKLTNSGIIQFIKNNPDLEKISVGGIDNITIDLIIGADQATKNRLNGIILHIRTFYSSILQVYKSIIQSQWLVVERI